ncbi:MAG: hypothetical protein ACRC2T_08630 [Thermoguttaceae bacterium]
MVHKKFFGDLTRSVATAIIAVVGWIDIVKCVWFSHKCNIYHMIGLNSSCGS